MFLSRIFVYPIKSAKGLDVSETSVDTSGPSVDRRWMLVDENGLFLSQRKLPRMALIEPYFRGADLCVEAPGMPLLVITPWADRGEWIPVKIWRDHLVVPHPDQRYSDWFSAFLGQRCRLVYLPDSVHRPVEPPFQDPKWRVSLADGYPLLLVAEASIDLLNDRLASPVAMQRFRPNLVISGAAPHDEDTWRSIRIGSVELAVVKPCARCSTILVNPDTADVGIEPLKTLATYRKTPQGIMFAQNALVSSPGLLRVGAPVDVVQ